MLRCVFFLGLACLLTLTLGCGSEFSIAPVNGVVKLNGKPLSGVSVEFQPMGKSGSDPGPGSMATTDAEGKFVLKTQLPPIREGAVVGKHRVRIYQYSAGGGSSDADADSGKKKGGKAATPLIPVRYNSSSELTVDVPADGLRDKVFDLTSP